jgi:putative oxidoreductase
LDWSILQRLFSTFANGWPGRGLLLLRLLTAAAAIHQGLATFHEAGAFVLQTPQVIVGAAAVLLLAGLWTPVVGTLVAIVEVWIAVSRQFSQSADPWYPVMLAALGVALAMLGPGAWSIDARLFGRKHIDLP